MKNFLSRALLVCSAAAAVVLCVYICLLPYKKAENDLELAGAIMCRNAARAGRTDIIERCILRTQNPFYLSDLYSSLALAAEKNGNMELRNKALLKIGNPEFTADYFLNNALAKIDGENFGNAQEALSRLYTLISRTPDGARKARLYFKIVQKLRGAGEAELPEEYLALAKKNIDAEKNRALKRAILKEQALEAIDTGNPDIFVYCIARTPHDTDKTFILLKGASRPSMSNYLKAFVSEKNLAEPEAYIARTMKSMLAATDALSKENLGKYTLNAKWFGLKMRFKWGVKNWDKYYYPLAAAHAHFLGNEKIAEYFKRKASDGDFVRGMKFNGLNYCRYLSEALALADMRQESLSTILSREDPDDVALILRANADILSKDPRFLDKLEDAISKQLFIKRVAKNN